MPLADVWPLFGKEGDVLGRVFDWEEYSTSPFYLATLCEHPTWRIRPEKLYVAEDFTIPIFCRKMRVF